VSGYLQRLAAGARKPESAIHPIVGALFSAPQAAASLETPLDEERVSPRERSEPLHEAVSMPPHEQAELRPHITAPARANQSTAGVIADAQPPAGSARSITIGEGPVSANRYDQGEVRAESAKGEREAEKINALSDYVPLIPTSLTPSPPVVVAVPSTGPTADSTRSSAAPSRPADEVEIHIGRIEVTAVHPSPIRAAPAKSPRRAVTLDDYLKRRDGRP
jgi:hypothetical protein